MEISKKEKILGSWWVLISFIPVFSGGAFIAAGIMAKSKKWKIIGLIYIIIQFVCGALNLLDIAAVVFLISIGHAIYIRKEYFIRRKVLSDYNNVINEQEAKEDKRLIEKVYKDILGEDSNVINNIDNKAVDKQELKQTKHKIENSENIEIVQKLDINSCSDSELSQLPGIGIILSKKAMDIRRENGQFKSLNEFYEVLNISQDKKDKLNKYLECNVVEVIKEDNNSSEVKNEEKFKNMGRKIDF